MQHRAIPSRASVFSLMVLLALPLWAQKGGIDTDVDGTVNGAAGLAGIQTNARDGLYTESLTLWFSLPGNGDALAEDLYIYRDGEELYRGAGPASVKLDVPAGTERFFDIRAERRRRYGSAELLGSARWSITIDRAPPPQPLLSVESLANSSKRLRHGALPGVRVMALVDAPGYPKEAFELPEEIVVTSERFYLIAWAIDEAGNESRPVYRREEAATLEVVNPVPGLWANRQLLYLEAEGLSEIYWTTDGSDPLLSGGRPYRGPERIDRTGTVLLRVAARTTSGATVHREVKYAVREGAADALAALEGVEFANEGLRTLSLPEGYSAAWAAALPLEKTGGPRDPRHAPFNAQQSISLPPFSSLFRREPLVVCNASSLWRFVIPLGGMDIEPLRNSDANEGAKALGDGFSLWTTAQLRALICERDQAGFFWRFKPAGRTSSTSWYSARRIVPLPQEAGLLEWYAAGDASDLPRSLVLDAFGAGASFPFSVGERATESPEGLRIVAESGANAAPLSLVLSSRGPGDTRVQKKSLLLEPGETLSIDASSGEELIIHLEGIEGRELGTWVVDNRAPPAPLVEAPANGDWVEGDVLLRISSAWPLAGSIQSSLEDLSGETALPERKPATGLYRIRPDTRGPLRVRLDLQARDVAGNESPRITRSFTIDTSTVYLDAATPAAVDGAATSLTGSRSRPCRSLAEAVALASRLGRRRIALRGSLTLDSPLDLSIQDSIAGSSTVPESTPVGTLPLLIEGGYNAAWEKGPQPSRIQLLEGASIKVQGQSLFLRDLHFLRPVSSSKALISMGPGSALDLLRTRLDADGTLLGGEGARLSAHFSLFSSRSRAFDFTFSSLSLEDCMLSIKSDADVLAALSLDRGILRAERLQLSVAASSFATGLKLSNSELALVDCGVRLLARDFASVLEGQGGTWSVSGGDLEGTARDVVLVSLDNVESRFRDLRMRSSAAGVSRGFDLRLHAPDIRNSTIIHDGISTQSELFSGMEPGRSLVAGNILSGWYRLSPSLYADTDVALFNRRHATVKEPNSVQPGLSMYSD